MGIYTGLIIHSPITNQRRFDIIVNEVHQLLFTHKDEIIIKEEPKILTVEALYGSDSFSLPLVCVFLRSQFFRIHSGSQPPEDVKQFGAIVWEILNILKEHYPSKIELVEDNLERCRPYYNDITESEALRRQVSCLSSRIYEIGIMSQDEMDDLWFVLYQTIKFNDLRQTAACLEVMNNQKLCPPYVFRNIRDEEQRILQTLIQDQENFDGDQCYGYLKNCQDLAKNIIDGVQDRQSQIPMTLENQYELPSSFSLLMFQIGETACVERVTFLLDNVNKSQQVENLIYYGWIEKIYAIVEKYCDGLYGADDHDVVRFGIFQYQVALSLVKLSKNPEYYQMLLQSGIFSRYLEIVEEACVFLYKQNLDKEDLEGCKLEEFVKLSLNLVKLSINQSFYKHLRSLYEGLRKIHSRLLNFTHSGSPDMPIPDEPEALRLVSEELYEIFIIVRDDLLKIDALLEYQDRYEEKWDRLFTNI